MRDLKTVKVLGDLDPVESFMRRVGTNTAHVTTGGGDLLMEFMGHYIESGYEFFEEVCKVTTRQDDGTEVVLFDQNSICTAPYHNEVVTTGSMEAVTAFVREHAKVPVRVYLA